jgi:D-glycero-D-manno-heptose 1,7-bisphosphate phosphatase
MKAFFVDRDGILNKLIKKDDGTTDSPQSEEEVSLMEGVVELLRSIRTYNVPIIEISNQPGYATGKLSREKIDSIEERVHTLLKDQGITIDFSYRCLHHPKGVVPEFSIECSCRKPKPGLLLQAAQDHAISLKESIFLGDNLTDVEAGYSAGCITILYPHTPHKNDTPERLKVHEGYNHSIIVASLNEIQNHVASLWGERV